MHFFNCVVIHKPPKLLSSKWILIHTTALSMPVTSLLLSASRSSLGTFLQRQQEESETTSITTQHLFKKKKKESEIFLSSVPELSACFSFGLDGVFISQKLLNMRLIKISSRAFWRQQRPNSQFLFVIRASENRRFPYTLMQLSCLNG